MGALESPSAKDIAADCLQITTRDQQTLKTQADLGLLPPAQLDGQSLFAWYRHRELNDFARLEAKYAEIGPLAGRAEALVFGALQASNSASIPAQVPCGAENGARAQSSSTRLFHNAIAKMLNDARRDYIMLSVREARLRKAAAALGVKTDGSLDPEFKRPNFRASFESEGNVVSSIPFLAVPNGFTASPKLYYIRTDRQLEGHQEAASLSFARINKLRLTLRPALIALDKAHAGCDRLIATQGAL